MNPSRRSLLQAAVSTSLMTGLLGTGALRATAVHAAEWNRSGFDAKDVNAALAALKATNATEHKDLLVRPTVDIAENAASVPVDIISNIPNTTAIAVIVDKNPFPLSSHFEFANGAVPEVRINLKLADTTIIRAVAKADGKLFTARKEVKVTVGGCG